MHYTRITAEQRSFRLWSLAAHRCLHTFNHHTSSVWALHSTHPNLERFYSGSRDGLVCVVDVEQCADISEGECVVLAREGDESRPDDAPSKSGDEGIRCIVAMDDEYVWTATGSADVKRWRDVGRRITRLSSDEDGGSYVEKPDGNVSIHVPQGLGGPFVPMPITNKRMSLDGAGDGQSPLSRTDSPGSRSVAFLPTPSPRNGPTPVANGTASFQGVSSQHVNPSLGGIGASTSAGPSGVRERLTLDQRRYNPSGAPIADSIMSDSSVNPDDNALPTHTFKLNGLPYKSLVCLGQPDSPYSFGFSTRGQDDLQTVRSRGSTSSVPHALDNLLKPDGAASSQRGSAVHERGSNQAQMARSEFQDREVAVEAIPLRQQPDEVIVGRSGLIRSLLLNDRQHVLSVDTEGEVAAWNIIRGVCIGRFSAAEVAAALDLERGVKAGSVVRKHSQEVLEMVKERIEGETMVITWCQVDAKIGSLVVHLEEGRVFDAEVYADEIVMEGMDSSKEDTRSEHRISGMDHNQLISLVNLGKWALANLFHGNKESRMHVIG